ncbi:MAG: hypothetical protein AB1521_11015 [Bacteroidota bacterium]
MISFPLQSFQTSLFHLVIRANHFYSAPLQNQHTQKDFGNRFNSNDLYEFVAKLSATLRLLGKLCG